MEKTTHLQNNPYPKFALMAIYFVMFGHVF
jgi:hypothetical protein